MIFAPRDVGRLPENMMCTPGDLAGVLADMGGIPEGISGDVTGISGDMRKGILGIWEGYLRALWRSLQTWRGPWGHEALLMGRWQWFMET